MLFRKKPVVIEADKWNGLGDNAHVEQYPGTGTCAICEGFFQDHGWVDTLEGGHIVCPGDWIITGVKGERYPCKPDVFHQSYEAADDES